MAADRHARVRRLCATAGLAVVAAVGLSIGTAGANPDPPAETPAQPPADQAPTDPPPAATPQAPAGEPFLPPGEWTQTPPAAPADPATPATPADPGSDPPAATPTPIDANTQPVATSGSGSSTSGTKRAGGGVIAGVAAAGAWLAGGFRQRPTETSDEHKRRVVGAGVWGVGGTVILVSGGLALAPVVAGGACLAVAGALLWWGAPARVHQPAAPAGPPVDLQQHLGAAQDHNVELNSVGVKTQTQQTANPVDDK